jgi:hypothetical protein
MEVISSGIRFWILLDTAHALFQMERPDWSPSFDIDPDHARETRMDLLKKSATEDIPIHLYHFPFPGFGKIRFSEAAFAFEALT